MTSANKSTRSAPASALVVGEALVDIIRVDDDERSFPGGSPMNVAVGLQRLGLPTTLHSSFGADLHGIVIARHLEASEVAVTTSTVSDRQTSVAVADIDATGAADYSFSIDWDPAEIDPPEGRFDAVHTGSIAAFLEPGATLIERLITSLRSSATISFDPNIRPELLNSANEARSRAEGLVRLADVVKASDEDIRWLYPDASIEDVQSRWLSFGPAIVVVTSGSNGATARTASGLVNVNAPPTDVVDTIGAGDSFMAGLLAALSDLRLLGGDRREELRGLQPAELAGVIGFAAQCAAITVSRIGADPPTRESLGAKL